MKKNFRWLLASIGALFVLFSLTLLVKWNSFPWSSAYDPSPVYVPPEGEILPTATFFSPSAITPTSNINLVWVDPIIPSYILAPIADNTTIQYSDDEGKAGTALRIGNESTFIHWVYSLVAPFPTLDDNLSAIDLRKAWQEGLNPVAPGQPLLLSQDTLDVLTVLWGSPLSGAVKVIDNQELLDYAWSHQPSLAIVPFEDLTPRWKVISIDGISPIDQNFDPNAYYLSVPISAVGVNPNLFQDLISNRNQDRFTSVVLTGVTALVRATAWTMELEGINYPARDIMDWLKEADILHISNEVPFARGCPYPDPGQASLRFCSDSRYIQLMESIGTDVVELTGDHFGDYGPEAMLYTLELYKERNWPYYGGGANREDAQEPVLIEHNGNKIGFLGCNAKGGGYATAGISYPGAVECDFDKMTNQIKDLRESGYQPIATFQHFEYYTYLAQVDQIRDARILTQAGAVIVSGSQAHQPQAFEIQEDAFVHHGLGNLFFDQIYEIPPHTAAAFIDRHIFYNGKHISTELLTIKFEDFARARPMTPSERNWLLQTTFNASNW
jgi:poly-gamma-glutamate synthesis protein (capsule biosynthesis protein)